MQNKKRFVSFILICAMFFIYSISVMAAGTPKGSIEITLTDGDIGTSKENVTFEYVKVADIIDGQCQLLDDYGEVDLNSIQYSAELEKAAQKINELAKADNRVMTDKDGKAIISDLEVGVYLLRVSDYAEYENVVPVLISIPTWNEEQGSMDFDVTVIPKHSPIVKDTPSEKVQTGDRSLDMLYIVLFVGSVGLIFVVGCNKRYCFLV